MPALAPIVAFEHHLKQDLSGYPEKIGSRKLNLCTMIVSIADVFDALRSTRPYRKGLATDRIRNIMSACCSTVPGRRSSCPTKSTSGRSIPQMIFLRRSPPRSIRPITTSIH